MNDIRVAFRETKRVFRSSKFSVRTYAPCGAPWSRSVVPPTLSPTRSAASSVPVRSARTVKRVRLSLDKISKRRESARRSLPKTPTRRGYSSRESLTLSWERVSHVLVQNCALFDDSCAYYREHPRVAANLKPTSHRDYHKALNALRSHVYGSAITFATLDRALDFNDFPAAFRSHSAHRSSSECAPCTNNTRICWLRARVLYGTKCLLCANARYSRATLPHGAREIQPGQGRTG